MLREVKYKEADKILTVLTEDEGKQTVCARGVLRKGSKAAAACQLLTFSEMTLFERGGKWYVSEGSAIEQFLGLRQDIAALSLGTYFAELLEAVSDEDSHDVQIMSLGLNALFALSKELYSPEHIKAVFELKLMCLAGYEPYAERRRRKPLFSPPWRGRFSAQAALLPTVRPFRFAKRRLRRCAILRGLNRSVLLPFLWSPTRRDVWHKCVRAM